jgi:Txe/YoeB family toxin of Txe-Axe toxin-antitoxin module
MKPIQFEGEAYEQFIEWSERNPDIFYRIDQLLRDISRTPFKGMENPNL